MITDTDITAIGAAVTSSLTAASVVIRALREPPKVLATTDPAGSSTNA